MSRGGKREGAGAPRLPEAIKKQPCPIKLQQWLIDEIDRRPGSRAVVIEKALIKAYKLKAPEKG